MIKTIRCNKIIYGSLELRESTQGRTNLEGWGPSSDWGSDLVGEIIVAIHRMAEKFTGMPKSERVHSCWASKEQPFGVQK